MSDDRKRYTIERSAAGSEFAVVRAYSPKLAAEEYVRQVMAKPGVLVAHLARHTVYVCWTNAAGKAVRQRWQVSIAPSVVRSTLDE